MVISSRTALSLIAALGALSLPGGGAAAADQPARGAAAPTCQGVRATIVGDAGADVLSGTSHADVIVGLGGNDRIEGGDGDDLICGGRGADVLYGSPGADRLHAGDGADYVYPLSGNRGFAGRGNDRGYAHPDSRLAGGTGRDWFGAHPAARVHTGAGEDSLYVDRMTIDTSEKSAQVLRGGRGRDTVTVIGDYEGDAMVISLEDGTATSGGTFGRITGFENATGGLGNDHLIGDDGPNRLQGYYGEDLIAARGGDDLVQGQEDADSLDGGAGDDRCSEEVEPPIRCETISGSR